MKLLLNLFPYIALTIAFGFVIAALNAAALPTPESVLGSQGISNLDQWSATTSPYTAITPKTSGKNIYAPLSVATTSRIYATTYCINNSTPDCITSWPSGGGGGSGTVTSVGLTAPTGLTVTGSPVTTSGVLDLSLTSGYVIPLTASTSNWNTAYGWGDHSTEGYLTVETDPVFTASDVFGVTTADIASWDAAAASTTALTPAYLRGLWSETVTGLTYNSGTGVLSLDGTYNIPLTASTTNWNTAYGWGNHALAGYITNLSTFDTDDLTQGSTNLYNQTHTGEVTGATTLTIADNIIEEVNLEVTNSPTDNYILSYDNGTGGFTWVEDATGGGSGSNWTLMSGGLRTSTSTDFARAAYFVATSTTATSTFAGPIQIKNNWLKEHNAGFIDLQREVIDGDFTLMRIRAPRTSDGSPSKEATLSLVNDVSGDNSGVNEEFIDFYNEAYNDSRQWGLRQAYSGTGVAKPFVLGFWQTSGNKDIGNALIILPGHNVGLGMTATSSVASTTILHIASSTAPYLTKWDSTPGTNLGVFTSTGRLGIGSSTPNYPLSIGTNFWVSTTNSGSPIFNVASSTGSNYFTVTAGGNVGIGTTTPANTLTVVGSTTVTSLNASNCDVKATASGSIYCGTDATGGGGVSFGADNQIPYTNGTTDNFDYSSLFSFSDTLFTVGATSSLATTTISNLDVLQAFNADTATALAANGSNCSSGSAPLGVDASGAVESCFDVWTEAENTAAAYLDSADIGSLVQAYDADLTTYAGITPSANVQSLLAAADYAAIVALLESALESALDTLTSLTNVAVSAVLQIPFGTNPTVTSDGAIAVDTTATTGQLKIDMGTSTQAFVADFDRSWNIASTTPDYLSVSLSTGTTTWEVWHPSQPVTLNSLYCETDTGTAIVRVGDGTNWSEGVACSSSPTADTSLANNTFTAREDFIIQIGTSASSPNWVTVDMNLNYTLQ